MFCENFSCAAPPLVAGGDAGEAGQALPGKLTAETSVSCPRTGMDTDERRGSSCCCFRRSASRTRGGGLCSARGIGRRAAASPPAAAAAAAASGSYSGSRLPMLCDIITMRDRSSPPGRLRPLAILRRFRARPPRTGESERCGPGVERALNGAMERAVSSFVFRRGSILTATPSGFLAKNGKARQKAVRSTAPKRRETESSAEMTSNGPKM